MGCSGSKEATAHAGNRPHNSPAVTVKSAEHKETQQESSNGDNIFIGVAPNMHILCRDEFKSKYTEDLMYRWRPAEILKVEGNDRSAVFVRYTGWAETFDHWVNLKTDCAKLAPVNLLTREQCAKGTALSEKQAQIAHDYFKSGIECTAPIELSTEHDANIQSLSSDALARAMLGVQSNTIDEDLIITMPAKLPEPVIPVSVPSNTVVAKRRMPSSGTMMVPVRAPGEDSPAGNKVPTVPPPLQTAPPPPSDASRQPSALDVAASQNPYCARDMVDVLDIFYKKGATVPSQKWRPAEIIEVVGDYVTIHYLNWDDKYNERLHYTKDSHRLSEFGSKATRNVSSSGSVGSGSQSPRAASSKPRSILRNSDTQQDVSGYTSNEGSELDRGSSQHRIHIEASRRPSGSRDQSAAKKDKPREYPTHNTSDNTIKETESTISAPTSEPASSSVPDSGLTDEQYSFTKSFLNYRKKRQADRAVPTDAEASKKALPIVPAASTSERPQFLKQVSMMSFSNIFGTRDGATAGSTTAAPVVTTDEAVVADAGNATPTKAKNGEEKERTQEEIAAREQEFLEKLEAKGLHVFAIEGDGNCLFRAVSHQLYLHQDMHDELRACVVEHLIRHRKRFEVFVEGDFEAHLKEMSKLGTWADDLEIRALEEITDRIITIYSSDVENVEEPINNNFEERNLLRGVPPLTISYHGQSHYNSIYDERYPLPLVHRKSRLLLRSRTALCKQDHLAMAAQGAPSTTTPAETAFPPYPPASSQPVMFHPSAYHNQQQLHQQQQFQHYHHHPGGYAGNSYPGHGQLMGVPPAPYWPASQQANQQVTATSGSLSESNSASRSESDELPAGSHYNVPYAPTSAGYPYNPAYGSVEYQQAQQMHAQAQAQAHGHYAQYYMPPPNGNAYGAPADSTDSQDFEDGNSFDTGDAQHEGVQGGVQYGAYHGEAAHYSAYARPAQQYGYHYPQSPDTAAGAY